MLTRVRTSELLPVGLSEVKAHLRLDHAHEDEYLRALIQASVGFVEEYLGRSLLTQSWRLIWEKEKPYPPQISTSGDDFSSVPLSYPPLRAILSVNRLMDTGEKKPIRHHRLEMNHQIPRLVFADVPESVEIEFETGYGDRPTDIPPVIRQAILMSVADFYENRDSARDAGGLSRNALVREMLDTYCIRRLA
jgi:uncharacterized phiE125 gp8 family phage protein